MAPKKKQRRTETLMRREHSHSSELFETNVTSAESLVL
jgi:hypothetical protein